MDPNWRELERVLSQPAPVNIKGQMKLFDCDNVDTTSEEASGDGQAAQGSEPKAVQRCSGNGAQGDPGTGAWSQHETDRMQAPAGKEAYNNQRGHSESGASSDVARRIVADYLLRKR